MENSEDLLGKFFFIKNENGPGLTWGQILAVLPENIFLCYLNNGGTTLHFLTHEEVGRTGSYEEMLFPLAMTSEVQTNLGNLLAQKANSFKRSEN